MKQRRKPITRAVIKKYFGKDARVIGFGGRYRVTTPSGGELLISQKKIKLIFGGDDIYRAMTLLEGECWGAVKAGHGSREFMLASIAHGEALGVDVQPDFEDKGATFGRWCSAVFVFIAGYAMILDKHAGRALAVIGALLAAALVFKLMKRDARRKEQRKLETSGFLFPRQTSGAEYASEEELRKAGLI
jgi:hypothetical protein